MRTKDLVMYCYCFSAWIFRNEGSYMYCYCFSAWIFGNPCELRILYVLILLFGLDIWKPVRTNDLILILIVILLGYLETRAN